MNQPFPPGMTVPDLGRPNDSPSKKEQFRILALNVAMGIEGGRDEMARGDAAGVIKDAEAVFKYLNTGH